MAGSDVELAVCCIEEWAGPSFLRLGHLPFNFVGTVLEQHRHRVFIVLDSSRINIENERTVLIDRLRYVEPLPL